MVDVSIKTIINVSSDIVAQFMSDRDNATKWYVNIKQVEWQTERPLRLGSRIAFVAQFLGKRLSYIYEVVEFDFINVREKFHEQSGN